MGRKRFESIARMRLFLFFASSAIWLQAQARADDIECPEPMKQVATNVKGEIDAQAQALLKITCVEIKGAVDTTVVNLFEKYPKLDRIALTQNLQSEFCKMMKSSSLSEKRNSTC